MAKKNKKNNIKYLYLALAIIILSGVSYALIREVREGTEEPYVTTGVLDITYTSEQNVINLTSALPQDDTTAVNGTPYSFTVNNNATIEVNYNLKLTPVCCNQSGNTCLDSQLDPNILRYKLIDVDNSSNVIKDNPTANMLTTNKTLTAKNGTNDDDSYQLLVWIKSTATNDDVFTKTNGVFDTDSNGRYVGKVFCAKVETIAEQSH